MSDKPQLTREERQLLEGDQPSTAASSFEATNPTSGVSGADEVNKSQQAKFTYAQDQAEEKADADKADADKPKRGRRKKDDDDAGKNDDAGKGKDAEKAERKQGNDVPAQYDAGDDTPAQYEF